MVFRSMLTGFLHEEIKLNDKEPEFFADLNLDLIVEEIAMRYKLYGVKSLLMTPMSDLKDIKYRQELFSDLDYQQVLDALKSFSEDMKNVIVRLSGLPDLFDIQREGKLLDTAKDYSISLRKISDALNKNKINSTALIDFRAYLENYFSSRSYQDLERDIEETEKTTASVTYYLIIKAGKVTVRKPDSGTLDYSNEIQTLFSKFRETRHEPFKTNRKSNYGIGHVQAEVLKLLEKIYPEEFRKLRKFASTHKEFVDEVIRRAFKELQFYLAYIEYMEGPKKIGLSFCIPEFTENKNIEVKSGFDLALAAKLSKTNGSIVTNDFYLGPKERILVVTGPNNGGKTTFVRAIGQVFYLASLGLPVPGKSATVSLQDNIFTHFERAEKIENLRGKLEDDLVRINEIIRRCTDRSIVVINEMLSSTTVKDATSIGKKILRLIEKKDCLCIFVTFLDEFSHFDKAVSMVAQVSSEVRTFKIIRGPSNGLVYANALAHKYRVLYRDIKERIVSD